ncbi:hypothetical protein [Aliirhizobium smilacinae]|uniref:Uncharacterized protein n=1 Tax=Aliirhizobium smilacinae TaxID=1395944 RepID=A0A5C4XP98_9HYPH|nr:hypothetical protein [Rhizobium smilacinae]TNM65243.1 hypothetical protein FHP24_02870 [Rhizobium smilacinae]
MNSSGIFDVAQLNSIRDAHLAWCAENSVDPKSPLGEQAAAFLLKAFSIEYSSVDDLAAALDRHLRQRASDVQIGSPSIPSSGD